MKGYKIIAGTIRLEHYERLLNVLKVTGRYANISKFVNAAVMDLVEKEEEYIKLEG